VIDLPANITFGANSDGFKVDQNDDVIRSVQAFRDRDGGLNIELWGQTTIITAADNRHKNQEFQQNAVIKFADQHGREFTWNVTRIVFDPSHEVSKAISFEINGRRDDVVRYRRI
jgi:hypothetical protein